MTIYLASGNRHKQSEIQAMLPECSVLIPADSGISFDPEENGATFIENSLIKAKALWKITHKPVLADDSGICVDILDGRPGIFSARYAGKNTAAVKDSEKLSPQERNLLLIDEATGALYEYHRSHPDDARTDEELLSCRFVCSLVLYAGKERFYAVQSTLEGSLVPSADKLSGSGGFGYDPAVYLPEYGKTVAELSPEQKNKISHRGKAVKEMSVIIERLRLHGGTTP